MSDSYTILKKELLDDFLTMVQIDSPSKDERAMADWLTAKFNELGCSVSEDKAGETVGGNAGNLRVTLKGNTGTEPLLFSAHMDTVEPARGIKPVVEGDVIRSSGDTILGSDDKAGIACILQLARIAKAQPETTRPDLEFSIHICEEIGLLGAKNVDPSSFRSKVGFILDDHDPRSLTVGSPSAVRLDYTVFGKASHAGVEPEKGISAIKVSSEAIAKMNFGRIDHETTANIGVIQGGVATNIITEKVTMKAEARSHDPKKLEKQVEHMTSCFEEVCAEWRKKTGSDLPRFEVDRKDDYKAVRFSVDDYPVKLTIAAAKSLGWGEMETKVSGGGTDGSVLSHKGIPCLVLGVGMEAVHSTEEHMKISVFEDAARLISTIVTTHAKGEVA
ncbi:MAG: M20/M25/M40 family metallo-hydrolase [bacterium]